MAEQVSKTRNERTIWCTCHDYEQAQIRCLVLVYEFDKKACPHNEGLKYGRTSSREKDHM